MCSSDLFEHGKVLSEEMRYGRNGHLLNPDLLDYKIPSIHEMPEVFPIIVESNDPEGPFGAKEAGEGQQQQRYNSAIRRLKALTQGKRRALKPGPTDVLTHQK